MQLRESVKGDILSDLAYCSPLHLPDDALINHALTVRFPRCKSTSSSSPILPFIFIDDEHHDHPVSTTVHHHCQGWQ